MGRKGQGEDRGYGDVRGHRGGAAQRDVMARLAAARPAALDDGAMADPVTRARELAAAVRHDTPPVSRKPWRPVRRPRWALAALPVAVAVTVTLVQGGGGGSGDGSGGGTASDYLLAAAAKVEARGDGSGGDYWFQEERLGALHRVPGDGDGDQGEGEGAYVIDQRETGRQWLASGSDRRWSEYEDTGTGPASPADERAWRAAGSPDEWTLPESAGGDVVRREPSGVVKRDAPGDGVDVVPIGELTTDQLKSLPTEPGALRERLVELANARFRAADGSPDDLTDRIVVWQAIEIAVRLPADAELRAAAYRLLSQEPGVRDLGVVEDRSGREGNGVALPAREGESELRLILDRSTGAPLGTLTVATRAHDGWAEGETTSYTTIVERRWTDTPPSFDRDLGMDEGRGSGSAVRQDD
ncbi:CU044_5270 family protein [Streptomyces sp. NPDC093252]|uniref:CU044_5270 family protein n=1 Tax=Streptomyces sp. NPDC093252 TaxID=3154980 RepID=UPI0034485CB5